MKAFSVFLVLMSCALLTACGSSDAPSTVGQPSATPPATTPGTPTPDTAPPVAPPTPSTPATVGSPPVAPTPTPTSPPPRPPADEPAQAGTDTTPSPSTASGITAAELAKHNTKTDCWVGYKGSVYDVTDFLPRHPGGVSAISKTCGTSGAFTEAFLDEHGTRMEGRLFREAVLIGKLA